MIEVPERFLTDWAGELPPEGVLADLASRAQNIGLPGAQLEFSRKYTQNLVKFSTWQTARVVESLGIPQSLDQDAAALFGAFEQTLASAGSLDTLDPLEVATDTIAAFSAAASALGAFQSVPIVGFIVGFGLTVAEAVMAWREEATRVEIEGERWAYRKADDDFWTGELLQLNWGGDWTGAFLPHNGAAGGIESFVTELEADGSAERRVYVPQGQVSGSGGLGVMPGTSENPRGWSVRTNTNPKTRPVGVPWVAFKPGFQQAGMTQWQSILQNTRRCYLVDAVQVGAEWSAFWSHMQEWGWGTRYGKNERRRIRWFSMPYRVPADVLARVPEEYRVLLPEDPFNDEAPGFVTTYKSVVRYAVEDQLRRRQRKYLGTITCAYVSRDDPAFRRDQELRELLQERRQLLLSHEARFLVDLDHVPDDDYRSALTLSRKAVGGLKVPGQEGQGFAADAPIALERRFLMPEVPGPAPAEPLPVTPGAPELQEKGPGDGLALLALLWLLG